MANFSEGVSVQNLNHFSPIYKLVEWEKIQHYFENRFSGSDQHNSFFMN